QAASVWWDLGPQTHSGAPSQVWRRAGCRVAHPTGRARYGHLGAALLPLGGEPWRARQHSHHEPRHSPSGLDPQKKQMGATERSETDRAAWGDLQAYLPPERLIFLDECGSNIALTPLYARAPRGQRAFGLAPRNRGKNTTLIAGLSVVGIQAPMI